MTRHKTSLGIALAFLVFLPVMSKAQSAGPRDYLNTPVYDARFFLDLLNTKSDTTNGGLLDESGVALPNNEGTVRNGILSLLYSFPIGSQYGGVAVSGGRGSVDIRGPNGRIYASGYTDPGITFHINFFGAPALRMNEFLTAIPETYFSFHLTVNAPLGTYDSNSPANIGGNRWTITPVLNLDITTNEGVSWLDLYAGARFFGDNNSYLGTSEFSQHPLFTLTAHYSHNIGSPKTWFSVGVYYDNGGESFINSVPQHNAANGFRPSVGISRAFGKFRLNLRLDGASSKPADVSSNYTLAFRIGGPLPF
jgi:Putative MetA-pathway of phenol degradation